MPQRGLYLGTFKWVAWEWLPFTWGPTIWIIGAGVGRFLGSYSFLLCRRRQRPCTGPWGISTPLALLWSRLCCHVDVTGSTPRSCTWHLTVSCGVSPKVNIAALCLPSCPLFIRMGRAKGAPLRAYLWLEMVGSTLIWWGARCLPIVLRWHYRQGSFIAWLLRLVLSIGAGKGFSKWADGGGLQMFALGKEWDESSGPSCPPGVSRVWGLCAPYTGSPGLGSLSAGGSLISSRGSQVHVVELRALTSCFVAYVVITLNLSC